MDENEDSTEKRELVFSFGPFRLVQADNSSFSKIAP